MCEKHLAPGLLRYVTRPSGAPTPRADRDYATCGARRRKGGFCTQPAGWGTQHPGYGLCKVHGGLTPSQNTHAAKLEAAERGVVMGMPIDVDPLDALLTCIRIAAGEVEYCTLRVHALEEEQATVETMEVTEREGNDENSYREIKRSTVVDLNVWIKARQGAMDRLTKYAKMAIDCGIAERQVKVAEQMGTVLGRLIQGILNDLQLTPAQWEVAQPAVHKHLMLLEGGQPQ